MLFVDRNCLCFLETSTLLWHHLAMPAYMCALPPGCCEGVGTVKSLWLHCNTTCPLAPGLVVQLKACIGVLSVTMATHSIVPLFDCLLVAAELPVLH